MSTRKDESLTRAFNMGKKKALEAVYNLYFTNLCYFANRIIYNKAEAEDIAVESLTILLCRHSDFFAMHSITSFLLTTVRNRCLKYLEAMKRKRAGERAMQLFFDGNEGSVLSKMVFSESLMEVYQLIDKLPVMQKTVFMLFYIEGMGVKDIAGHLTISPNAVYINKRRALKTLRNNLFQNEVLPKAS